MAATLDLLIRHLDAVVLWSELVVACTLLLVDTETLVVKELGGVALASWDTLLSAGGVGDLKVTAVAGTRGRALAVEGTGVLVQASRYRL